MDLKNIIGDTKEPSPVGTEPMQLNESLHANAEHLALSNNNSSMPHTSNISFSESEIRQRNSILSITNDEDVDLEGHRTPNASRRTSATTLPQLVNANGESHHSDSVKRRLSSASKPPKDVIKNQLEQLKSLVNKEEILTHIDGKPKRYKNKPVWARDYVPQIYKNMVGKNGVKSNLGDIATNGSRLSVPSISGTMPQNDFNKLVTNWIWANVEQVKMSYPEEPKVMEYIELELKVGRIIEKTNDRRVNLPVNTETVLLGDYYNQECRFEAGVLQPEFQVCTQVIERFMAEAADQANGSGPVNGPKRGKFVTEKLHVVDMISSEVSRNQRPSSTRVTLDLKTKRRMSTIKKQRVNDLFFYLPNTNFDLRLSLSIEWPEEMNDVAFSVFQNKVSMQREKNRVSYIHQNTATRIDMTKVKEGSNKQARYEIELEMNTQSLMRSINKVSDDPLLFPDMVQAFLDNARIITRAMTEKRL
ncbi:polynucleotide 5'-phosphatase [Martiniozyma asiatica (nom. inval.)]|nr:polynucleotide 5'-phosphatase [Martiniozyma asiatica]